MQRRFHQNGESRLIANAPRPAQTGGLFDQMVAEPALKIGRGGTQVLMAKEKRISRPEGRFSGNYSLKQEVSHTRSSEQRVLQRELSLASKETATLNLRVLGEPQNHAWQVG